MPSTGLICDRCRGGTAWNFWDAENKSIDPFDREALLNKTAWTPRALVSSGMTTEVVVIHSSTGTLVSVTGIARCTDFLARVHAMTFTFNLLP
jgi:hypothetical protein